MPLFRRPLLVLALAALASAALPVGPLAPRAALAQDKEELPETPTLSYPKELKVAGRRLLVHEPAVLGEFARTPEGNGLAFRFPLELVEPSGGISYGVLEAKAAVHLDLVSRTFLLTGIELTKSTLPGLAEADRPAALEELAADLPKEFLLRLEMLIARPGAAKPRDQEVGKLNADPPKFFVRNVPTNLIQIDGDPVMLPLGEFPLEYVANSASDLIHEPRTGKWWYLMDGLWLTAGSLDGPWDWATKSLPIVLSQLPATHPRGHVRRYVKGTPEFKKLHGKNPPSASGPPPEVIVSREPSELVVLRGDPLFTLLPGVKLMQVANTDSDLFFHPKSGTYYLSLSGRWFTTEDLDKPMKRAYGALPAEFLSIPPDHPRAHIRWVVPGTPESLEGLAYARLAPVSTVKKRIAADVRFAGEKPSFAPLAGGELRVATNTEDDVISGPKLYYVCTRGVWFSSEESRSGYRPAATIPEGVLALDSASGCFHVTSVVPGGEREEGMQFAVGNGYFGVFEFKKHVVHGTGWSKAGLLRNENWYPRARTYGENRWYDPLTGIFQPRSVRYTEDGKPTADVWSEYTGSYGRIREYANRYQQGGRRMTPFRPDSEKFDTDAGRPDVFAKWPNDQVLVDGVPKARLPFADRTAEMAAPKEEGGAAAADPATDPEPQLVCDAEGNVYRKAGASHEVFKDGAWAADAAPADVAGWLDTFERLAARVGELRRWAEARRAPLPVNPSVTSMK